MKGPIKNIPTELYDSYTMGKTIPVYDWYLDGSKSNTLEWSDSFVQSFIDRFTFDNIKQNNHGAEDYKNASSYHVTAIEKYPHYVVGKNVAVIGSLTPWIEAILINAGANHVTTVEYNVPKCTHDKITCISYDAFMENFSIKYDAIFCYSSIEHSGLGRYGDDLNPNGDLETMAQIRDRLTDKGVCFLGIPVGCDGLAWNAHRIYGPKRLSLIMHGFDDLEWIGCDRNHVNICKPRKNGPQPIIILRKT